jgi:DNA-binding transcriptional LysR family regulator
MQRHPQLQIDLSMEDRLVDAVGQGFDVSIRLSAELADSSLIARRLASLSQMLCASPAYLQQHGRPASVAALRDHALLNYSLAQADDGLQVPSEARASVNNSLMLRAAGGGHGHWCTAVLSGPARHRPGPAGGIGLQDWAEQPRHVYVVYPTQRHLLPKVRAFVDFLAEELPAAMGGDS